MENKIRIRREFAPLNISATLYCYTAATSPVTQAYAAIANSYVPDRSLTPCIIRPNILIGASDMTWTNQNTNALMASESIKWYANGVEITASNPAWMSGGTPLFSIDRSSQDMRGSLTIYKNVTSSEKIILYMEATFNDPRRSENISFRTDEILVTTFDKGKDTWSLSIEHDDILYNPFEDGLLEYDYKLSHGLIADPLTDTAASHINDKSYIRDIPIIVRQGGKVPVSDYHIQLWEIDDSGNWIGYWDGKTMSPLVANGMELLTVSNSVIRLDLRLIDKRHYLLQLRDDYMIVAAKTISISRIYPAYIVRPKNTVDVPATERFYYEELAVDFNGRIIKYPQPILKVRWKTSTPNLPSLYQGAGIASVVDLEKAQMGNSSLNDLMDLSYEHEQAGAFGLATCNMMLDGVPTEVQLTETSGSDTIQYIIN